MVVAWRGAPAARRVMAAAILCLGLPVLGAAAAAAAEEARLSQANRADVARIEAYLNGIKTLKARFLQVAPSGALAQGMLYLSRPGKMRIQYDPPVPVLMVATGIWLIYYDGELGEPTYLPVGASPAGLLLKKEIKLSGDLEVTSVERGPGVIHIGVKERGAREKGSLRFTFADHPLMLKKWTIVDAKGRSTQVALINPEFGTKLDPDLFLFEDPTPPVEIDR